MWLLALVGDETDELEKTNDELNVSFPLNFQHLPLPFPFSMSTPSASTSATIQELHSDSENEDAGSESGAVETVTTEEGGVEVKATKKKKKRSKAKKTMDKIKSVRSFYYRGSSLCCRTLDLVLFFLPGLLFLEETRTFRTRSSTE